MTHVVVVVRKQSDALETVLAKMRSQRARKDAAHCLPKTLGQAVGHAKTRLVRIDSEQRGIHNQGG